MDCLATTFCANALAWALTWAWRQGLEWLLQPLLAGHSQRASPIVSFLAFGSDFFDGATKELNDDEPKLEDPDDNTVESEASSVSFAMPVHFVFCNSFWRTAKSLDFPGTQNLLNPLSFLVQLAPPPNLFANLSSDEITNFAMDTFLSLRFLPVKEFAKGLRIIFNLEIL